MNTDRKSSTITFHYTVKLEDGTVVDSSGDQPVTFNPGSNVILPAVENELSSMHIGEKKTIMLTDDQTFGNYDDKYVVEFKKEELEIDTSAKTGDIIELVDEDNNKSRGLILEIAENTTKIDFNHPLAGKKLYYDLELVNVEN
jgi:FKBP-type peptidyl-prolyl cis-trans isomerase 2